MVNNCHRQPTRVRIAPTAHPATRRDPTRRRDRRNQPSALVLARLQIDRNWLRLFAAAHDAALIRFAPFAIPQHVHPKRHAASALRRIVDSHRRIESPILAIEPIRSREAECIPMPFKYRFPRTTIGSPNTFRSRVNGHWIVKYGSPGSPPLPSPKDKQSARRATESRQYPPPCHHSISPRWPVRSQAFLIRQKRFRKNQ